MKRSRETAQEALGGSEPPKTKGTQVSVSVPGFAALYAAALDLPLERLQGEPAWCVESLTSTPLAVEVS